MKIEPFLFATLMLLALTNQVLADENMAKSQIDPSTQFDFRLFDAISHEKTENIILSPVSAYLALSMTLNGAAGNTCEQMAKVLGITSDAISDLNEKNHTLCNDLAKNDKIQLKIANAIFVDKSTPVKPSFATLCKQIYDAKVHDFDSKNLSVDLQKINDWCNQKTDNKIPIIIESLKPNEKLVILNAVYFRGLWANPFKTQDTQDDKFITATGELADTKMMHQRQKLLYLKGDTFKAVGMPYTDNRQSLYIFLPNKKLPLSLFQTEFNQQNWHEWLAEFRTTDISLSLPKLSVDCSMDLSSSLKTLGMSEAFDSERADFSKLVYFAYRTWISRVLQKTHLELDEQGTEAAAATAAIIGVRGVGAVSPTPVEFRVDHPFILALVDNESQEVLFLGVITKP